MRVLLIFTGSFPFSIAGENTFIPQEIDQYSLIFDKIIIVPIETDGYKFDYSKNNIEYDYDYSNVLKNKKIKFKYFFKSFIDKKIWPELIYQFFCNFNIINCKRAIVATYNYYKTENILKSTILRYNSNNEEVYILTYWFSQTTFVLSRLKNILGYKLFTRAHGYDIYEERVLNGYFPFRKTTFKNLDFVFPASLNGESYLKNKYPFFEKKIIHQPLGIYDNNIRCLPSKTSNYIHLVSCSSLVPVKRIDLLINGLVVLCDKKDIKVKWTHIGSGPLYESISQKIASISLENLELSIVPYVNSYQLFEFYKKNEIDLFINVSESEGGRPVAIMEALSCGIPILASNVGGNPEIVNEKIGYLLSMNPSPNEISNMIYYIIKNKSELNLKRKLAYNYWNEKFNALNVYKNIINLILK
jgi:glycosyltransferase involved in cell wall biosynthesis